MKPLFYTIITLVTLGLYTSCVKIDNAHKKLPPGMWRGVLVLDEVPQLPTLDGEEVSQKVDFQGELPFNFEVKYVNEDSFYIELINGKERIVVDDIIYGLDRATAKDTITINFPIFDTYIKAIYEDNIIEGDWFVNYKQGYSIPFKAYYGQSHRFTTTKVAPVTDLTGKWDVTFEVDTEDAYPAIGEFVQTGNLLTGTFRTETGDYRYLDGTVQGNKAYLSCFDGAHAFLFQAKYLDDGSLTGLFFSGKHYVTSWEGIKNDTAKLQSPLGLSKANTDNAVDFSFIDTRGKLVSLDDPKFDNKPKIIKIMGTWCPNCKDASDYLQRYTLANPDSELEIISLSFERYQDTTKALAAIQRYIDKANIPWTVLYGGQSNKGSASKQLPWLSEVISYPTLIFLNRQNMIEHIYTGFNGPATSEYKNFENLFKAYVEDISQ